MSTNNSHSSVLINKSVPTATHRFLNANLSQLNANLINMQNSSTNATSLTNNDNINNVSSIGSTNTNLLNRKTHKSISISSTLNNSTQYQYNYSNTNSSSSNCSSQPYFPSMLKNHASSSFSTTNANISNNKKFSNDYQQAIRFDYSDAFTNNHNIEFLTRISQMQRLQMDTVEWERKKKMSKKKSPNKATTSSSSNTNNLTD